MQGFVVFWWFDEVLFFVDKYYLLLSLGGKTVFRLLDLGVTFFPGLPAGAKTALEAVLDCVVAKSAMLRFRLR